MYIYMYVCMWVFPSLGRLFFFCLTILLVVVIILIIIMIEIVINEYNDFCRYLYFYNNCCYYSFSSSLSTSLPVCRVSQASAGRRRWRGLSTPFSLPSLPPPSSAGTHSSPRNVKGGQCQFLPSLHPLLYPPLFLLPLLLSLIFSVIIISFSSFYSSSSFFSTGVEMVSP